MKNVQVSILQLDVSDRKESNLSNLSEQMKKIKIFLLISPFSEKCLTVLTI